MRDTGGLVEMRICQQKSLGMGLYAYRNHGGQTEYYVRSVRLLGHRRRIWLGPIAKVEAESYILRLHTAALERAGEFGAPKDTPLAYTFAQAMEQWLVALKAAGRDSQTTYAYRRDLSRALPVIGNLELPRISLEDAERLRVHLQQAKLSHRTRKNTEHTCSMLFKFACHPTRDWAERNPFDGLISEKAPKGSRRRKDDQFCALHPREDARFFDGIEDSWRRCAAAIGLYLGVRASAVASLRIQNVNLFDKTICVSSEFNKGHARGLRDDQWLPIPRHLMPYLKAWMEQVVTMNCEWLFPNEKRDGHILRTKLSAICAASAKTLRYPNATFHSLRAICNNRLRASEIEKRLHESAAGARGVLGHGSEASAQPYIRHEVEYLRPIIAAYDDWLDYHARSKSEAQDLRAVGQNES